MKFYNSDIRELVAEAIVNCHELTLNSICTLTCRVDGATIKSDGTITPPTYIVEVKRAAENPNNNIIALLSSAYNINTQDAEAVYSAWLNEIKKVDKNGNEVYVIDGVGQISFGVANSLNFKSDRKLLSSLNFLTQPDVSEIAPILTDINESETMENEAMEQTTEPTKDQKEDRKSGLTLYILLALFLLSSAAALYLYLTKPREVIKEVKIESVVRDTVYVEKATAEVKVQNLLDGKYHIISGVYFEDFNAKKCVKLFAEKGYDAFMQFVDYRGVYFVSLGSYESYSEAQNYLNSVQSLALDDPMWIHKFREQN